MNPAAAGGSADAAPSAAARAPIGLVVMNLGGPGLSRRRRAVPAPALRRSRRHPAGLAELPAAAAGAHDREAARPDVARRLPADRGALADPGGDDARRPRRSPPSSPRRGVAGQAGRRDGGVAPVRGRGAGRAGAREGIDRAVALPLYPHESRATTGSSLNQLEHAPAPTRAGIEIAAIKRYPDADGYVRAVVERFEEAVATLPAEHRATAPVLFSAHGLPEAYIKRGDPYLDDMRITVETVTRRLNLGARARLCFQSRVGPQRWLGPTTEAVLDELAAAGTTGGRRRPDRVHGRAHRDAAGDRHPLQGARPAGRHRPLRARAHRRLPPGVHRARSRIWSRRRRTRAAGPEVRRVRVTIVGGGISGLAAAHLAAARGHDVMLIDDAPPGGKPGGLIASVRRDGFLCEHGPAGGAGRSRRDARADRGRRSVEPRPAGVARGAAALRLRRRRAAPVPRQPAGAVQDQPAVGGREAASLLRAVRRARHGEDESVHAFVARRFGREAAERAAAPALIGVFAGDAAALSVRSALPRVAAMEREHGSVLRALMRRKRGGRGLGRPVSFPDGLGELPAALARALGSRRRVARAAEIAPISIGGSGGWRVTTADGAFIESERLVLATPAAATAALLAPHAPEAAAALRAIPHAPVAVVCMGFRTARRPGHGSRRVRFRRRARRRRADARLPVRDVGVLRSRARGRRAAARAAGRNVRSRRSSTRTTRRSPRRPSAICGAPPGLARDPDFVDVWRARPGIPQYDLAHAARVRAVDDAVARAARARRHRQRASRRRRQRLHRRRDAPRRRAVTPRAGLVNLDSGRERSDASAREARCARSRTFSCW